MRFQRHRSALVLASVATVLSFVGATVYTQRQLLSLDSLSSVIETNAAPTLEHLGSSGVRLERLRAILREAVERDDVDSLEIREARAELRALRSDLDRYLLLTPLPGESELWAFLRRDLDDAVTSIRSVLDALESGEPGNAAFLFRTQTEPALDRVAGTVRETLEFDVRASEGLAREIRAVRGRTTREIVILDLLATAVAAVGALIAFRFWREHDHLLQQHSLLLEQRVTELDRFAGRVAHDILSPLDNVALGTGLAARSADPQARAHLERAQRSVQRVKQLVQDLLEFARAGAQSHAGSRCQVEPVLASVAADCAGAAAANGITIVVEPCGPIAAGCRAGVLTSIVHNLVRNAIKYMGDSSSRQVTLRALRTDAGVRVEVADTGSGIPPELGDRIFEPFVRGDHADAEGMGLGLATVKRLVEGHGGTITVQSTPGIGTVFLIDLPAAPPPTEESST